MADTKQFLTTNQLANDLGVQGNTIRRGLCTQGHYMGLRPIKLPNSRLLWSREQRDMILRGEKPGQGCGEG